MKFTSGKYSLLHLTIIEVVLVIVSFYSGFFIRGLGKPNIPSPEQFPLVNEAYTILEKNFYTKLPENKTIQYQMIKGMVEAVDDPYTSFVEPQEHELQTDQLNGKFGGIGCSIGKDADNDYILFPYADSPAEKAGILEGDRLISVDSIDITPETPVEIIQAAIRGPVGEEIKLALIRKPDNSPFSVTIKREEVALPSVTWNTLIDDAKIAVLHVNVVAATTVDELKNGLNSLKKNGAEYFILDLRDNSGGLVEGGVNTARLFLEDGVVIEQQYGDAPVDLFTVDKKGEFSDIPLVVFVNHYTASSSEIIAGALQSHQRAPLIGTQTYGKDSIQLVFSLSDESSIHVTAAHWWLPDHTPGNQPGLLPDILLTDDQLSDSDYIEQAKMIFYP